MKKLTAAQRELLEELQDAHPGSLMVGRPSKRPPRIAHALERRGLLRVETNDSGFSYAWLNGDQYSDLVNDEEIRFHMERTG